jgi:hypothetical protein
VLTQDEREALRATLEEIQLDEEAQVVADLRQREAALDQRGNRLLNLRDVPLRMR